MANSFPIFQLSPFPLEDLFRYRGLSLNQLEILNKKVYNYPSEEIMSNMTDTEKNLMLQYYGFLAYTYFGMGDINDYKIEKETLELLFDYSKWGEMTRAILEMEDYLSLNGSKSFYNDYNSFVKVQFNLIFELVTKDYNDYMEALNKIYKTNKFKNGDFVFKPFTKEKLSPELLQLYNDYKKDFSLGVNEISIIRGSGDLEKSKNIKIQVIGGK